MCIRDVSYADYGFGSLSISVRSVFYRDRRLIHGATQSEKHPRIPKYVYLGPSVSTLDSAEMDHLTGVTGQSNVATTGESK